MSGLKLDEPDEVTQATDCDDAFVLKPGEALSVDAMNEYDAQHVLDANDLAYLAAPTTEEGAEYLRQVSPPEQTADKTTSAENELEFSKKNDSIGDHICPLLGAEAAEDFTSNDRLKKILEASKEDMGKNFSLDASSLDDSPDKASAVIAMAVSDPNAADCPLVFVSQGFEDLTGYASEFVTGRSCRFLQPTSKVLNDGVNLNDRKLMRHFCDELQPDGTTIVNLLLNERKTGERFWNLLRMQYVMVDGIQYIFAVQCTLDGFMPRLLTRRLLGQQKNAGIVDTLGEFLHALGNIREELRRSEFMPILELKGYYTCALNCLQLLPALSKISTASPSVSFGKIVDFVKDGSAEKPDVVGPGCIVTTQDELKYPTYKVPANTQGKVLSIDSFGTATIDWKDIGKKGCLKRDVSKLVIMPSESSKKFSRASSESSLNGSNRPESARSRGSSTASRA